VELPKSIPRPYGKSSVLIDRSNSQRTSDLYKIGVRELGTFLKQTLQREEDKVFIETFDNEPDRPMPWMNGNELGRTKLDLQPGGGSSLFDAIELACRERFADNNSPARRVLILLADGEDNASRVNIDAAINAAQRARAAIFAVSTREGENTHQQRGTDVVLKKLAEDTGGYAFLELSPKEIQKAFSKIGAQLDGMFEVDFVPTQAAKSGDPRFLQVKLSKPCQSKRQKKPYN
jgi:VWFA-related protein